MLLSVVLLCTFTLIEIRNRRLSRSLCRSKRVMFRLVTDIFNCTVMFELVFDKLFHLDDCGVQVVLAPGVWLLSCARLKFKNHLEKSLVTCHPKQ